MFQFNVMTQIGFKHVLLQSWLLNLMLLLWLMIKSTFLLPKKLRHFLRLFSKIELFNICLDISNDDLDDFQQNIYPCEEVNWVYFKILFNCRNMWEVTAISYAIIVNLCTCTCTLLKNFDRPTDKPRYRSSDFWSLILA